MSGVFLQPVGFGEDWTLDGVPPALAFGMDFEFDPEKDAINRAKHGYGLASGEHVLRRVTEPWGVAPPVVGLTQYGRQDAEPRYRLLSLDHEGHLIDFIFTMRGAFGSGYAMRAISYRRASYDPYWMAVYVRHVEYGEVLDWLEHCNREGLAADENWWPITHHVASSRRTWLESELRADAILERILVSTTLRVPQDGAVLEASDAPALPDYSRLCLEWVPMAPFGEALLDYVFNGRGGLRAAYARAPVLGEVWARSLLRALRPQAEDAIAQGLTGAELEHALASYGAVSTKIWPVEADLQCAVPSEAEIAIAVPRWQLALGAWRSDPNSESYLAGWGVQAPRIGRLALKGGFLRSDGTEWIPARKLHRAEDLYRYGWT